MMPATQDTPCTPRHILIVEDETALALVVQDYLLQANMRVDILSDGSEVVERALSSSYDLIVLDLMLPDKDGLTICREIRQESDVPIIMVTAKVEEVDRLLGLELGADDYLCKPFSPRELVARVRAVLRRLDKCLNAANKETTGLIVDAECWSVTLDGTPIDFTRREFQLLKVLHARPGRVFSRSQLLDLAFPDDSEVIDRTIDSHIRNIRSKIKAVAEWEPIRSIYGVGYAFEE